MKTTSRFALAAAAGLFVGGIAFTPANAADLGGDCCADLEERVAELEATTARKGNRKVSLEISGQVNRALLAWDDGIDSDAYVVDNGYSSTRFRFVGKAQMKPGYTAGFAIEIEIEDTGSDQVFQGSDEGVPATNPEGIKTRLANWFIESEKYGRVTVGQQSMASDGIAEINLANVVALDASSDFNAAFRVRTAGGGTAGVNWGDITNDLDGLSRNDGIRYDSPSVYGFILSTSWGDNDIGDVALRFKKEWNSFRIAAGVAYFYDGSSGTIAGFGDIDKGGSNQDSESVAGSISVMHVPSGLYATFAAGQREFNDGDSSIDGPGDGSLAISKDDEDYFYLQAGIEKKFFSYGKTTIYGEYGQYNNFGSSSVGGSSDFTEGDDFDDVVGVGIRSSEVTRYGFGVVQTFDSAALDVYAQFQYFEADLVSSRISDVAGQPADIVSSEKLNTEDFTLGVVGARIKF